MSNNTTEESNSSSPETDRPAEDESENSSPKPGAEEVYEYHDENGDLRFEKVRKQTDSTSEGIFLRHPDKGNGMNGEAYLPYRLQDFPNRAKGDSLLMTYHESESTADAVRELDIPATTTPLGPEMNAPNDVVPHFKGLQVVIFPDNDEEGRYHAGRVGDALLEVATCVKIVQLDGLEQGDDASDWIRQKQAEGLSDENIRREIERQVAEASECDREDFWTGEFGLGGPFWSVTSDGKVKVSQKNLVDFLAERGFRKIYDSSDESEFVQVEDNVVRRTSREKVKDHVLSYVREEVPGERGVEDELSDRPGNYFSRSKIELLPELEREFHYATPQKAYRYYQNGFVEITARGYALRSYSELGGLVWAGKIIDRPFIDLSHVEDRSAWEWQCFLTNASGGNADRVRCLRSSLGYLQHPYKDPALTKAIIFMDEVDSEFEDGRTGKSLTAESLQYVGATKKPEDGRNFSFNSRFAFQEVESDAEVVYFNDVRKNFPFGNLFSAITDALSVEKKGKDKETISFADSPKFLISTNHVIEGGGASFEDRAFQIEFSDHYGKNHKPVDDFGHRLFEEWDEQEWARFDNTMMTCIQEYLRDGLVEYERENVDYRRLKQNTCASFAAWALDGIVHDEVLDKDVLYRSFRSEHEPDFEGLKKSTFGRWLGHYARTYDLEKISSRPRRNGDRVRCVTFVPKN